MKFIEFIKLALIFIYISFPTAAQKPKPFKAIAFYTAKSDQAHISFVHEANSWFPEVAAEHNFTYDSTDNWTNLNDKFLAKYQLVIFLDTRPEETDQRKAFQKYMENGGAWLGFHFAGFALNNSKFNQDWDWYHNEFLGSGQYKSNTWRPTSAILKIEDRKHPIAKGLSETFKSSPNEWYRWEHDLRKNKDIKVLLSIDPSSFPLGTGPKLHEIWHSGDYPVVWTNTKYKMLYVNMGHNDIDYENKTNKELSFQFQNQTQNQMIINALKWFGRRQK